jgi:hypothetical protein
MNISIDVVYIYIYTTGKDLICKTMLKTQSRLSYKNIGNVLTFLKIYDIMIKTLPYSYNAYGPQITHFHLFH